MSTRYLCLAAQIACRNIFDLSGVLLFCLDNTVLCQDCILFASLKTSFFNFFVQTVNL